MDEFRRLDRVNQLSVAETHPGNAGPVAPYFLSPRALDHDTRSSPKRSNCETASGSGGSCTRMALP
jgi:hypothetical protein